MNTNDATRATEEAMPEAQSENGASDLLLRTIKRHDAAYAYFASAVYLSDDGIIGREPTAEEAAIYGTACGIERQALSDVCCFPVSSPEDYAAKARHLRKYNTRYFGNLEDWQVENLLRSMLPEHERDQLDDGTSDDRVVVNVGRVLSEMLRDHAEVTATLNRHEGDDAEADKLSTRQCEIARAISGYRPLTKQDERSKAEFLRRWTSDTNLTAEEQTALVASLMPPDDEDGDRPLADNKPIFEPSKLSMEGLFVLHDGLRTISHIISGLACQPRFVGRDKTKVPPQGDMLQRFAEFIDEVMEDIYDEALVRAPATDDDRDRKFALIAGCHVDGSASPEYVLTELAKEAEKIGGAK